jgi:glycosyltransferase involved in cell wall biosynthesis
MSDQFPRAQSADVALLLEGTFPYVSGGVSSWVNQMIRAFPDIRFAIVFIGSRREDYGKPVYAIPDNVVHVECHYLYDFPAPPLVQASGGDAAAFERSRQLHEALRNPAHRDDTAHLIRAAIDDLRDDGPLAEEQFLYSHRAWDMMTDYYRRYCTDPSFTDYFWTVRIMHKPLWQLVRIAENLIPVKVFHTISTGYAGFLGALLRYRRGRPLLVSEHGIYTKERKIDLFQSQWIRDNRSIFEKDIAQISYFRDLWVRFFETMGKVCYDAAEEIVALYEGNRLRQVIDGAPAEKTRNIPNGINLPRLAPLRDKRPATVPHVMCLIGRVVPIKDVKTFIRAMLTITREMPDAEGWIAGPEDEDPDFQKIDDVLPKVGVLVLSSISEALPLVVLEGFAAGVPSVTTDVGSCRQLLFGLEGDDAALGAAGAVVRIADPAALAAEVLTLLRDEARWHEAQAAGVARVERYYTQEMMVGSYRELYERLRTLPDLTTEAGATAAAAACPHHAGQNGKKGAR